MNKLNESKARYDAEHTRQVKFKFNLTTDADILAWLDAQPSKQAAVKSLIRRELLQDRLLPAYLKKSK